MFLCYCRLFLTLLNIVDVDYQKIFATDSFIGGNCCGPMVEVLCKTQFYVGRKCTCV